MHRLTIWRTKDLVLDLAQNRVTAGQKFAYLTMLALLNGFLFYTPLLPPAAEGVVFWEVTTILILTSAGLHFCYRNAAGKARERLVEYVVCLSLPIYTKTLLLFWSSYALVLVMSGSWLFLFPPEVHWHILEVARVFSYAVAPTITAVFYWRLSHHIEDIAKLLDGEIDGTSTV